MSGQLKANKKVAELTEEDMKQKYVQTVINAGNQVNEVLTAQERLLSAQLNEAMNMYKGALGVIALYIALGGSTN